MRTYETMYIVAPELLEEQVEALMARYQKVITDMGGVIAYCSLWERGRRRLAYEIKGRREGIYVLMRYDAGPDVPAELDRLLRISDDILRHLTVLPDEDELKQPLPEIVTETESEPKSQPVEAAVEVAAEAAAPAEAATPVEAVPETPASVEAAVEAVAPAEEAPETAAPVEVAEPAAAEAAAEPAE